MEYAKHKKHGSLVCAQHIALEDSSPKVNAVQVQPFQEGGGQHQGIKTYGYNIIDPIVDRKWVSPT